MAVTSFSLMDLKASNLFTEESLTVQMLTYLESSKNIRLSTSYKDYPINVYLIDDTLYAEVSNLYVKFDLNNIESVATLLKDQFGIDIPLDKIGAVLKTIKDKKVDLSQLNLNNMDLSKIDLSILEDFEYNDGIYDITIKNIGKSRFNIKVTKTASNAIFCTYTNTPWSGDR